jgi:hypothetical protein
MITAAPAQVSAVKMLKTKNMVEGMAGTVFPSIFDNFHEERHYKLKFDQIALKLGTLESYSKSAVTRRGDVIIGFPKKEGGFSEGKRARARQRGEAGAGRVAPIKGEEEILYEKSFQSPYTKKIERD